MESSNSHSGSSLDEFWRDAGNGGFFSYNLSTNRETDVRLIVRYWGNEWGGRKFDISVDDEKLLTEDNTGRWYQSQFQEVSYAIPESMVKGKDHIRVRFQALPDNTAGAVYRIRLVRKNNSAGTH
jgi:hypothetical protein